MIPISFPAGAMQSPSRAVAWLLLGIGVVLVFVGFTVALGATVSSAVASAAAIAALLYAGATWFGALAASPEPAVFLLLVDRSGRIVAGRGTGETLAAQFPPAREPEIARLLASALSGAPVQFSGAKTRGGPLTMLPVRGSEGFVLFVLVTSATVAGTDVLREETVKAIV